MTQYATVPDADRAQIDAFMVLFRPLMGQIARLLNVMEATDAQWTATVSKIIDGLDAEALIADPTGLAGAVPMSKEAIQGLMTEVESALAAFNQPANRANYVLAAGAANTIGG